MPCPWLAGSTATSSTTAAASAKGHGVRPFQRFNLLDIVKVATGYRASKVIGTPVVNDANDTVGKVDDIIIGQDGKSPFVVLSVGGFLGMGNKLVVLPYEQLKTTDGKIVLPGATKDALKSLPEFKYASG